MRDDTDNVVLSVEDAKSALLIARIQRELDKRLDLLEVAKRDLKRYKDIKKGAERAVWETMNELSVVMKSLKGNQ